MLGRRQFIKRSSQLLGGLILTSPFTQNTKTQAQTGSSFDDELEKLRSSHNLPALACAVIVKGKTIYSSATGFRKQGSPEKVSPDDQFHLGSCTKAMTATLIGMLVEESKLNWRTTIIEVFPELGSSMDPAFQQVTIDMLLAHRAGFSERCYPANMYLRDLHFLKGSPKEQRYEYVRLMLQEAPASTPGTKYEYTNTGYGVLGAIIDKLTNTPWEAFIKERLFIPLKMNSAGFGAMGQSGMINQPHQHVMENGKVAPVDPGPLSDNPDAIAPAANVHCNIADWAKFTTLHVQENKDSSILKASTLRHLHTAPFGDNYMGGWMILTCSWAGGRTLTHTGSNNQNFAVTWLAPIKDFAVLIACNLGGVPVANACDELVKIAIDHYLET